MVGIFFHAEVLVVWLLRFLEFSGLTTTCFSLACLLDVTCRFLREMETMRIDERKDA